MEFNHAPRQTARTTLMTCCGSAPWAEQLLAHRPFDSVESLHTAAENTWRSLPSTEWREAFAKHPKIGDTSASEWSTQEQQGMSGAAHVTANAIRALNTEYERRFGYIFIVCATKKSAEQMRTLLEQRLTNEPDLELTLAAAEQAKIMHLRLDKLLAQ